MRLRALASRHAVPAAVLRLFPWLHHIARCRCVAPSGRSAAARGPPPSTRVDFHVICVAPPPLARGCHRPHRSSSRCRFHYRLLRAPPPRSFSSRRRRLLRPLPPLLFFRGSTATTSTPATPTTAFFAWLPRLRLHHIRSRLPRQTAQRATALLEQPRRFPLQPRLPQRVDRYDCGGCPSAYLRILL